MEWTAEKIALERENLNSPLFSGLHKSAALSLLDALEEARKRLRICREVSEELGGAGFQIRESER